MLTWRNPEVIIPKGIIIGSDEKQEWLLPWWWENYAKHNNFPVTFIDFGLSERGKAFCKSIGELTSIPSFYSSLGIKETVSQEKQKFWEAIYKEMYACWEKRSLWHKKPLALLQTPYQHTLWLDTDCEVHDSLDPLFDQIAKAKGLLLCKEGLLNKNDLLTDEILFNSGVIGFSKGSPYILEWAQETLLQHNAHFGDQNLLSRLIHERKWPVEHLDKLYNWRQIVGEKDPNVKITHWVGEAGKFMISLKQLNLL
ncbi:MAG: hypothetical protein JSS09_04710 [Verrucomicrobia bacterium]|nr:hypothetical protein [Verrucomicrobiota bacterium]